MKKIVTCMIAHLLWAAAAHAAPPQSLPPSTGERLAATCTGCHGMAPASALPPLTGQSKDALLASLRAFKDGSRPATIMTQLAKGYTDEQLEQIATWFAAQQGARR